MAVTIDNKITVHGLKRGTILWADDFTASDDKDGLITAHQSFHCYSDEFFKVRPKKGSGCTEPGWSVLRLTNMEVNNAKAGILKVKCTYSYLDEESTSSFDGSSDVYESSIMTSEEPIVTHPKYAEVPQNEIRAMILAQSGAWKVEETESLTFYPANETSSSSEAVEITDALPLELWNLFLSRDVDTYLAVHQTFRATNYKRSLGSTLFNDVGKIDNPPSNAPSLDSGCNWLYSGATISRQDTHYVITREWIASGPGGWVTELYES